LVADLSTTLRRGRPSGAARPGTLRVVEGAPVADARRGWWRRGLATALVVIGDAAALTFGVLTSRTSTAVVYAAVALVALAAAGAYHLRFNLSALDDAPRIGAALALAALALAPFTDSGGRLLRQAALAVPTVVAVRIVTYLLVRLWRRGALRERCVIAGSGHVGIELAHLMAQHPEFGLECVGFAGAPFPNLPAPLLGELADLDDIVADHSVREVTVAFGPTREVDLVPVLRTAMLRGVHVHVVPRFFEVGVAPRGSDADDLWGIPLYRVRQAALQRWAWRLKRGVDVICATAVLIVMLPVMVLAAALVRCTGRGPILFRQRRIGQHGREFELLKFRTLPADHVDATWNADEASYRGIGSMLRRLSIDELPQLWNVLRGDMSLVGPRPERGYLVEEFNQKVHGYRDRHRLPVGLTGWAQVHGLRGDTSLRERVRFDNQYIEHWSLWRDIVILFRTGGAIFRAPHRGSQPDVHDPSRLEFGVAATVRRPDDEQGESDAARSGAT
jgi:exopolysaccharide biosynthesis polyprenyl glycosylphosphotransferase